MMRDAFSDELLQDEEDDGNQYIGRPSQDQEQRRRQINDQDMRLYIDTSIRHFI